MPLRKCLLECTSFDTPLSEEKLQTKLQWIRTIVAAYYLFVAYYGLFQLDFASISLPMWRNLNNHWWKCITVWNIALQVRYSLMSIILDLGTILPNAKWVERMLETGKRIQDYCFIALDIPNCVFVCSVFWFIVTIKHPLFFPQEMNVWIPDWYNHAIHTFPLFLSCLQVFTQCHRNPPVKSALMGLLFYCAVYMLCALVGEATLFPSNLFFIRGGGVNCGQCILYTKWSTGQWIYLIIGDMAERISVFHLILLLGTFCFVFPVFILISALKLNELIWKRKID